MAWNETSLVLFRQRVQQAGLQQKRMVPISLEIPEDMVTPVGAYMTLRRDGSPGFLLESVAGGERTSRWTFLGSKPFRTLTVSGHATTITTDTASSTNNSVDPRVIIADELAYYSALSVPELPPFFGGMVGTIGYEAIHLIEPTVPDPHENDLALPDITLMYFDVVIAFDHVNKSIFLIKLIDVLSESDIDAAYQLALDQLHGLESRLLQGLPSTESAHLVYGTSRNDVTSNMTRGEFESMVAKCQEYIRAGDAFQVVVSQRFACPLTTDPFTIYRCLRRTNPSPYLFFFDFEGWQMVGSSPERLVQVINGRVVISPIAGTRPRGKTEGEDAQLAAELLADPKECAEHIMLVDLARNDVGRVATYGTVCVPPGRMMYVERYSRVMHIVSDVEGRLKPDLAPIDAFWASFPAGTLSGAPKIRAMQIIAELEPTRRGPYGGCVGFLGFDGNIETAIVIRTAVIVNSMVYYQVGAGIVYDSVPANEFDETCHKGAAMRRALTLAGNVGEE